MADKEQIGLTVAGNDVVNEALISGFFAGKDDVARFAFALALREGSPINNVKGAETTWHTRGLDANGELRAAVELAYPDVQEPYRAIESLIDSGLTLIRSHLKARGEIVLSELLHSKT